MSTATIYALKDGNVYGYVGQTSRHPEVRLYAHTIKAKRGSRLRVHEWMREVMSGGREIGIEILETCPAEAALERERFHIERLTDSGVTLNNSTGARNKEPEISDYKIHQLARRIIKGVFITDAAYQLALLGFEWRSLIIEHGPNPQLEEELIQEIERDLAIVVQREMVLEWGRTVEDSRHEGESWRAAEARLMADEANGGIGSNG